MYVSIHTKAVSNTINVTQFAIMVHTKVINKMQYKNVVQKCIS